MNDPQVLLLPLLLFFLKSAIVSCANYYFSNNRNNGLALAYRTCNKIAGMLEFIELVIHYCVTLIKLLKPGAVKLAMTESIAISAYSHESYQKELTSLVTRNRILFGLLTIINRRTPPAESWRRP
ncbi:MAG: hypothetical protein ABGY96_09315 [bacterium]